ncbi:MAG TPA: putative lipid II flippase FtsW [Candidatus Limnocylindria bacterium]|jgi:cell division protein FtsW|nr:putative lipid II flippase FtsW [Candidatus Limnocylindria bacterium]
MTSAVSAAAAATSRRPVARGGVRRERHEPAYALLLAVLALTAIGVVMVYSASSVRSYFSTSDPASQGLEQLVWAGIGLTALVVAMRIDFRHLRYLAIPIFVITLGLLVAVLIPGIGAEINGSRRWIIIPGVGTLQPAEFAKLAVVLYLAHWLDRRGKEASTFWNGLIPFGLLVAPGFLLIAMEPDLGTAGVYAIVAISIFFMAGANLLYLGAIGSAVVMAAWLMVSATSYQLERVQTFLDPFRDPLGSGYNTVQALMALGLGGITGLGLGESRQKFLYLPAPSTDFIFAIIGEEWGLVGTLTVVALFVVIAYQGYRIAITAPDTFSGLVACGVTTWLVVQAFVNMMVVAALLPVTGIPLPFISAGGSALTINLAAVGILLSISRETSQTGSLRDAVFGVGRRDRRAHLPRAGRRPGPARRTTRR